MIVSISIYIILIRELTTLIGDNRIKLNKENVHLTYWHLEKVVLGKKKIDAQFFTNMCDLRSSDKKLV